MVRTMARADRPLGPRAQEAVAASQGQGLQAQEKRVGGRMPRTPRRM